MKQRQALFGAGGDGACEAFLACRDHPTKADVRAYLEQAWLRVGHLIGDREQHFINAFRSDFHAKSWELFLLAVLTDAGVEVEPARPMGPDICAKHAGQRVWIEAVVPSVGAANSADRVFQRPPGRYVGSLHTEESVLLRYCAVLEEKLRKVDRYITQGLVLSGDIVLVAVGQGAILDSDVHDHDMPAIAKALFAIGEPVMCITPGGNEPPSVEVPSRFAIAKSNGSPVPTNLFLDTRFAAISGVLFAQQAVWNLQPSAADSLGLIHNPLATAQCPRGALPVRRELWVEGDELRTTTRKSRE